MITLKTKWNETVKIFTDNIEESALAQVVELANSPLGEGANIRIMPDVHSGKGCVIGTSMQITDKVCPNLVGIDIACGVYLAVIMKDMNTNRIDFRARWEELDAAIRKVVPFGKRNCGVETYDRAKLEKLRCWNALSKKHQTTALMSVGSLGGGNHFIEAYEDGMIAVHSGSRNLGLQVATHYQNLAIQRLEANAYNSLDLANIAPQDRQAAIQAHKENQVKTPKHLAWLEGQDMEDYIHDMQIINNYAFENRSTMLHNIATEMGGYVAYGWDCIHNYIDANRVLRKGAIAAKQDEVVLIPLNMKDGMICGTGKGNPDWNESAPHGAGRLYSRSAAKREFSLEDFQETMKGIHSTTIGQDTIDEAPFAYKNMQEILHAIGDTVRVNQILKPVYNFKASE